MPAAPGHAGSIGGALTFESGFVDPARSLYTGAQRGAAE